MNQTIRLSFLQTLAGLAAVALFSGCSTTQIHSPTAAKESLSKKSTYRFVPDRAMAPSISVSNNAYWLTRVRAAIGSDLAAKGYKSIDTGRPDLLVAFHVVLKNGENATVMDNYSGYKIPEATAASAGVRKFADSMRTTEEGTLIVDIIDPVKKEIIWRGWARSQLHLKADREQRIHEVVSRILAGFPSRS